MNLLHETEQDIEESGHAPEDIVFIGSRESGYRCTWEEFTHLADIEYDNGYGAQEVATDLEIVFRDGATMWRHEYDGSEAWFYSTPFTMPAESKPITRLVVKPEQIGWCDLADINQDASA